MKNGILINPLKHMGVRNMGFAATQTVTWSAPVCSGQPGILHGKEIARPSGLILQRSEYSDRFNDKE